MFMQWRRMIAMLTAVMLLSTMYSAVSAAAETAAAEQLPEWASAELAYWQAAGLLKGNAKGELLPGRNVTRAELAAMLDRIFKFNATSQESFSDVPADAWYASHISKAAEAGILKGSGNGQFQPLNTVTRQEAATMAARAFGITREGSADHAFVDDAQISAWAKDSVYALKAAGYVQGSSDGSFQPLKALTRAEAVKLLHNLMGGLIQDAASHSDVTGRNLVVNTAGGTLLKAKLSGSLYLTPGIGDGSFAISQSAIAGTVYVHGGGVNSITITDSTVGHLIIDRVDGPVRVAIDGASTLDSIIVRSDDARLELDKESTVGQWLIEIDSVLVNGKAETRDTIGKEATRPDTDNEASAGSGGSSTGGESVYIPEAPKATQLYTHEQAKSRFADTGAEGLVKQYLTFLEDPTYTPALASPDAKMPELVNALTFVNYSYPVQPSIFPSLREINSSVLNAQRTTLWLGTDEGVTKVNLASNKMTPYTTAEKQLMDNRVLLIIDDGAKGVFVITETGVSHIYN